MSTVNKEAAAAAKANGTAALSAKNYGDAVRHFTEAIGHDPTNHIFYSNRCVCYVSSVPPNYADALHDAEKCISLKPGWAKGYKLKGLAECSLGKLAEAEATYAKGLQFAPQDAVLLSSAKTVEDARARGAGPASTSRGERPQAERSC